MSLIKKYWENSYLHYWLYLRPLKSIDCFEGSKILGYLGSIFKKLIRHDTTNFIPDNNYSTTNILIHLAALSLIFSNEKIFLPFLGAWLESTSIVLAIFIIYYIFVEVKDLKELFACKSFVHISLIGFLIALVSQFQSFYIDFPITTIRPGAILNYPFTKGLSRILQLSFLFLFSLCIIHYSKKDNNLNKLINININIATLLSTFLISAFLFDFIWPNTDLVYHITVLAEPAIRLKGFFREPYVLSMYLLTAIPFLLLRITNKFSKKDLLFLILQSFCLILTFSRGPWLAFLSLLVLFFFFIHRALIFKYWKYILLFFLCGLILIFTFSQSIEFINDFISKNIIDAINPGTGKFWSTKLRLETFSAAIRAFQSHTILGVGFFNFHFYGGYNSYPGLMGFSNFYYNSPSVNNLPLTILVETGLVGFLFFIYVSAIIIRKFLRTNLFLDVKDKLLLKTFFISMISLFITFLFNSNFIEAFLWFYIGLIVSFFEIVDEKHHNAFKQE